MVFGSALYGAYASGRDAFGARGETLGRSKSLLELELGGRASASGLSQCARGHDQRRSEPHFLKLFERICQRKLQNCWLRFPISPDTYARRPRTASIKSRRLQWVAEGIANIRPKIDRFQPSKFGLEFSTLFLVGLRMRFFKPSCLHHHTVIHLR